MPPGSNRAAQPEFPPPPGVRLLQAAVAVASLVPILAGGAGIVWGPAMAGPEAAADAGLDSHFRYLSGLLLGIGLGFASTVPRITAHRRRFGLLAAVVVAGGLARLWSLADVGPPPPAMLAALAMELVVTPALALWQARVARAQARGA